MSQSFWSVFARKFFERTKKQTNLTSSVLQRNKCVWIRSKPSFRGEGHYMNLKLCVNTFCKLFSFIFTKLKNSHFLYFRCLGCAGWPTAVEHQWRWFVVHALGHVRHVRVAGKRAPTARNGGRAGRWCKNFFVPRCRRHVRRERLHRLLQRRVGVGVGRMRVAPGDAHAQSRYQCTNEFAEKIAPSREHVGGRRTRCMRCAARPMRTFSCPLAPFVVANMFVARVQGGLVKKESICCNLDSPVAQRGNCIGYDKDCC